MIEIIYLFFIHLEHILQQSLKQERLLLTTSYHLSTSDSTLQLEKRKNFELNSIIQLCNTLVSLFFIFFLLFFILILLIMIVKYYNLDFNSKTIL